MESGRGDVGWFRVEEEGKGGGGGGDGLGEGRGGGGVVTAETSGGFNLGLVKIHQI